MNDIDLERATEELNGGGVAVIPTDTIYGAVARSLDSAAIERLYTLKGRRPDKPFIILTPRLEDIAGFGVVLSEEQVKVARKYWPGPYSLIFRCDDPKFEYLHRGTDSLAFRVPDNEWLQELMSETGPLSAPSANPEGQQPPVNISEAREYFSQKVSCYIDGGSLEKSASRLILVEPDGSEKVLRG